MKLSGAIACFISSASLVWTAAGAQANDLAGSASDRARARCEAAYGPGFSPIDGGDSCVWVGGHVRLGFGSRGDSPDTGWANGGTMRVNAGERATTTGHLRLPDAAATGPIAR